VTPHSRRAKRQEVVPDEASGPEEGPALGPIPHALYGATFGSGGAYGTAFKLTPPDIPPRALWITLPVKAKAAFRSRASSTRDSALRHDRVWRQRALTN
jgi:hypothetical protein